MRWVSDGMREFPLIRGRGITNDEDGPFTTKQRLIYAVIKAVPASTLVPILCVRGCAHGFRTFIRVQLLYKVYC